ncbi:MAG: hypothetical protein HOO87_06295, partial [Methyloglobulus sp.]|nr:hypothetical protein [Methyloglobulus sp.]
MPINVRRVGIKPRCSPVRPFKKPSCRSPRGFWRHTWPVRPRPRATSPGVETTPGHQLPDGLTHAPQTHGGHGRTRRPVPPPLGGHVHVDDAYLYPQGIKAAAGRGCENKASFIAAVSLDG